MTKFKPLASLLMIVFLIAGFGISPAQAQSQDCGSTYTVQRGDTFGGIARRCGVSYSALVAANPDIEDVRWIFPGDEIQIPARPGDEQFTIPVTGGSVYIVKPHDTLGGIATYFNVTTQALVGANSWLEVIERVYPGMRLTLPEGARQVPTLSVTPTVGPTKTTVTLAATGFRANTELLIGLGRISGPYHQVGEATTDANGAMLRDVSLPDWADELRGDYAFVVQIRNNPNVRAVSNHFNLIASSQGEPLIPDTGRPTVFSYTVQSGDTLFEIAQRYNTTLDQLLTLNPNIEEAAVILPGQVILLPQGTRPAGPYITVSSRVVSPGDEVRVRAYNFPSNASVDIRLAPRDERYVQPYDGRTNAQGSLDQVIHIPDTVPAGTYRIIVATTERREITQAVSQFFQIRE